MAALPSWVLSLPHQMIVPNSAASTRLNAIPPHSAKTFSRDASTDEQIHTKRRLMLVGVGTLVAEFSRASFAFAQEVPDNFREYIDFEDGYTYFYPADWRDFEFLGHDSAFKDRFAALQHVRVGFIPTDKNDIRELGPMEEVIFNLVKNVYAAPTQLPTIYDMKERTVDGKNYWTFEYELTSPNFSRTAFATIAIGNGRYYTLVVGANERRWTRLRNKLKVVADSFKMLSI